MSQISAEEIVARKKADPYRMLRQCKPCGLYKCCQSPFMQGSAPAKARVLFIGEAPGFDEDMQDTAFVGKAGAFLRESLRIVGIDPSEVRFTNAVACRPPNNDIKFQPKAAAYCRGGVWQEIQDVDPDIVVLAGNVPMKSVLGIDKITHWSGTPILSSKVPSLHMKEFPFRDGRERVYLPLMHPSYVLRTRHTEIEEVTVNRFGRDLSVLKQLLDGTHSMEAKLPPHRVIGWPSVLAEDRIRRIDRKREQLALTLAFHKEPAVEAPQEDSPLNLPKEPSKESKKLPDLKLIQRQIKLLEAERKRLEATLPGLRDAAFDEAIAYLDDLHSFDRIPYDYETPDLDPYQDYSKILCISFAPLKKKPGVAEYGTEYPWILPKEGVCIPVDHPHSPFTEKQREVIKHKIREFLLNKKLRKMAWNHVFEYIAGTVILGTEPEGLIEDPMYEAFATNEMPGTHGLKYNTRVYTEYGGYEKPNEKAIAAAGGNFERIPGMTLFPYNAMDSIVMPMAERGFYARIAEDKQWRLLHEILHPAVRLLARMEIQGIQVNQVKVRELTSDFDRWIAGIVKTAAEMPEIARAEYKIRELVAEKLHEGRKEAAFDAAKAEFKAAKAAFDEAPDPAPRFKMLEGLKAKFKSRKLTGARLESARALLGRVKQEAQLAERTYKALRKKAEVAARKAERTQLSYANTVDKVEKLSKFSLAKNSHVQILLYTIFRFPIFKTTPTGIPAVDDEVIQRYAKRHPVVKLLEAFRQLSKIRSTYLMPLHPDVEVHQGSSIVKPDGKIHPNVKAMARTGRLMSGSKGRGKSEEGSKKFKFNIQNTPRPIQLMGSWLIDAEGNLIPHTCPDHLKEGKGPKAGCGKCGIWVSIRDCLQTSFICDEHRGSGPLPVAKKGCQKCGRIIESDYSGLEAMTLGIIAQDAAVLKLVETQIELEPLRTEIEDLEIQNAFGVAPPNWQARVAELQAQIGKRADYADFHKLTASLIYNKKPEEVTKDERQDSKSIAGFGLLYGRSAPPLAADMNWTIPYAEQIIDMFWAGYRGIKDRNDREIAFARQYGYVEMITYRRRRLPSINSPDKGKRGHAEREAVNSGIQGPCSDFNLIAATLLDRQFRKRGWRARVIALVHDAIYVDAPFEEGLAVARLLKQVQEYVPTTFPQMTHPLRVERKVSITMGKG